MAEMPNSRAEKLASAKKKLKQYQINKENPSESGRSTPSKKNHEGRDENENGGSTYSLSENLSSNISRTESPVLSQDTSLCLGAVNGNSPPDVVNGTDTSAPLPTVSLNLFQSPDSITPQPDFFDTLSSGDPSGARTNSQLDNAFICQVGASTPNGQPASTDNQSKFLEVANYSFPDVSCSPIIEAGTPSFSQYWSNQVKIGNASQEQNATDQKNEIEKLKAEMEEMRTTLKHHVNAIDILVSEKSELQSYLDQERNMMQSQTAEVEELQGRLRASRHRVGDLERDLKIAREEIVGLETKLRDLHSQQATYSSETDSLRKHVGDLELEVSDLKNKLATQEETITRQQAEMNEKSSQLSLAQVRIQQLSGGPELNRSVEMGLRNQVEELTSSVANLQSQLSIASAAVTESKREYQHYVDQLLTDIQKLKAANAISNEQCSELQAREQQLVQQVSELERQLNRAPAVEDPAIQTLRLQLAQANESCQALQVQLDEKASLESCLREGLDERALRIQELEAKVERLETERPDTANLQAAIESDKVAASRAVAQNYSLKKQMEELQDAIVTLSNDKARLTEQLQQEEHQRKELSSQLNSIQVTKIMEVKAQQTERPRLQESEVQTATNQPLASPEMMSKLEEKFRKTMAELADMSDEKQRLEHLVTQLQGETETIGEYITLYQIQRGMLRQRAQEKDEQVAKLAQDKEALRNKLAQLNCLVQRLVGAGHNAELPTLTNGSEEERTDGGIDQEIVPSSPEGSKAKMETAEKIQSLLSEIGSHNLVTTSPSESTNINFHPCPWCSGRLINV